MTINTNTGTTWRDLAGELTPAQVDSLTRNERKYGHMAGWSQLLLERARDHAQRNKIDRERFGHLPAPAGAVTIEHWEVDQIEGDGWRRHFEGSNWQVGDLDASIIGTQCADGRIERAVRIESDCKDFDAGQLRLIAAALCEAAEELDRHAQDGGNPYPVNSDYFPCCHSIGQHSRECRGTVRR